MYCSLFLESQRLTTSEARLKIVPEIDTLFTKIPAEIDFTTTTQAEKIDQTSLGVFQDAAETGQFIKQLTQRLRLLRSLSLKVHDAVLHVIAVASPLRTQ